MKKRIWAAVLALCMVITVMPTAALAAADEVTLGSSEIASGKYYAVSDSGITEASQDEYNIAYDGTTVTLKDANLESKLIVPSGTTITLIGENTSGSEDSPISSACIESSGAVTINGEGSYTAYGTSYGINADGGITVTGDAAVTVNAKTAGLKAGHGSILIDSSKTLYANVAYGTSMPVAALYTGELGDNADTGNDITVKGHVVLNGTTGMLSHSGKITLEGCTAEMNTSYIGMNSPYGDVKISDSNVSIIQTQGTINTTHAIDNLNKSVVISDSTMVITGFGRGFNSQVTLKDTLLTVTPLQATSIKTPVLEYSDDFDKVIIGTNKFGVTRNITDTYDNAYTGFTAFSIKFFQIRRSRSNTVTFDVNGGVPKSGQNYGPITVKDGEKVNIPLTPTKDGFEFDEWKNEETGETYSQSWSSLRYQQITPTCDMTITAQWKKIPQKFRITATVVGGKGGKITPESADVPEDTEFGYIFTITPDAGYTIKDVKVDGVSKGAITEYTFEAGTVTAPCEITAEFEPNSYTLKTIVDGVETTSEIKHEVAFAAPAAPARDGFFFEGWKAEGGEVYYAGQQITPTGDMTLTAQWAAAEDWTDTDNNGDLSVDVGVDINVTVSEEAEAAIADESRSTLAANTEDALESIMNGNTPDGISEEEAAAVRAMLNVGAPKTEVQLTISAELKGGMTEGQEAAVKPEAGEEAQVWDLSVAMVVSNKDGENEIGKTEAINISRLSDKIEFVLTTGQDLTNKDVRVAYIHGGEVLEAESKVTDAKNGVVTVYADRFSPYIILTKTKASSGSGSGVTTYGITVEKTENGSLTASARTAARGDTVTITAKPGEGFETASVTVKDANGNQIKLTDKGDGRYTFTMPGARVTVSAVFAESAGDTGFEDVEEGTYYADAVKWAVEKGVTDGMSAERFAPDGICTRAQAVTFLWRAAGSPEPESTACAFTDIDENAYYYKAVLWAVEKGITVGTSDTTFSPGLDCTRGHIVTFLWRANGAPASAASSVFTDVAGEAYYSAAVDWAVEHDVTRGMTESTFQPEAPCTRGHIVTFIYRAEAAK